MNELEHIINSHKIVILYFYSNECNKTNKLISKIQKILVIKIFLYQNMMLIISNQNY